MVFRRYERAVDAQPGVEITAVCDVDERRLSQCARGSRRLHSLLSKLLDEPLDAVLILTPNDTHAENVRTCLARGLDVLCEKPLAPSSTEAAGLLDLAEASGHLLYAAMHSRVRPEVRWVLAQRPPVRRFEHIYAENWYANGAPWYFDASRCGGGVLLDVGINHLDWLSSLTGGLEPRGVEILAGQLGAEHACRVEWGFPGGTGATTFSWIASPEVRHTRLTTTDGSLYELDHGTCEVRQDGTVAGQWENDEYEQTLHGFLEARRRRCAPDRHPLESLSLVERIYAAH